MAHLDTLHRVPIGTRAELTDWLEQHCHGTESVWLVLWRKGSGRAPIPQREIAEEAIRFGWIDSLSRKLDASRTMLLLSPRRAGSGWSAINKAIATQLLDSGAMRPTGIAAVDRARRDGSWSILDGAESLLPPPDLEAAFARVTGSQTGFAAFPGSSRRALLEWIALARTPETRARRVAETAFWAARGARANVRKDRERAADRRD